MTISKKTICLGLLILMAGLLSACGKSASDYVEEEDSTSQQTVAPVVPDVKVSFSSLTSEAPNQLKNLECTGGTFPKALYLALFKQYEQRYAVHVKYNGLGSAVGVRRIQTGTTSCGASDNYMENSQLAASKNGEILHIPTAFGAVVAAYNLPDVKEKLKLSGEQLAAIFLGEITYWDDPKLVGDLTNPVNPGLVGKHHRIITVYRRDGSGSTYGFTDFLSEVSTRFKDKVGTGTSVYWPVGLSANGNDGIAAALATNPYAIGYTELNFAINNKLSYARVQNSNGKYVDPTTASIQAAAAASTAVSSNANDLRLKVINSNGENAYPITTATYLLVYKEQKEPLQAMTLSRLLWWLIHDGQKAHEELLYAPLPPNLVKRIEPVIKAIGENQEGYEFYGFGGKTN
jgi:phosphate transport system substrate-binding protein